MPDLPEVQDRALSRVPAEIWHEIFEFVTSVPRKYEFTMDDVAYITANEEKKTETGIPTSQRADEITKSRFSTIRVCKDWYGIGIKALWSHLRIDVCTEPIRAIEGIQGAISRDVTIASYVIRITLRDSGKKPPVESGVLEGPLRRLTSQLPSLQIFICPGIYGSGMVKPSLDIVVWKTCCWCETFRHVLERASYIENARVFSICVDRYFLPTFDFLPMLFYRLESLRVKIYSLKTIDNLTRSWEFPNLRTLSIQTTYITRLLNFIEKWSANLEILEISLAKSEWLRSINLPNVKELRIYGDIWMSYQITGPKVEQFCLLSFRNTNRYNRDDIIRAVDYTRSSFPALRMLKLHTYWAESYDPAFDYRLTGPDIRDWVDAGLEIDISLCRFE
jgi:hypothetical protein